MPRRLESIGDAKNSFIVDEDLTVLRTNKLANDMSARGGDPGEFYPNSTFHSEFKYVRSVAPVALTEVDGTVTGTLEDSLLYAGTGGLGRFAPNSAGGGGGGFVSKSGASAANQIAVWQGAGSTIIARPPTIDAAGNTIIQGTLSLGSGTTLISNPVGTLRGAAMELSFAGVALGLSAGVLDHDDTAVTPGTFNSVTVNQQGHVTAGSVVGGGAIGGAGVAGHVARWSAADTIGTAETANVQFGRSSGGTSNGNVLVLHSDTFPAIRFRSGTTTQFSIVSSAGSSSISGQMQIHQTGARFQILDEDSAEIVRYVSRSEVRFNNPGNDRDFVVEAIGQPSAFFVRGSDGNVGFGLNNPGVPIHVLRAITPFIAARFESTAVNSRVEIQLKNDAQTWGLRLETNDAFRIMDGSTNVFQIANNAPANALNITTTTFVIGETGGVDFRWESDSITDGLVCDAGDNHVEVKALFGFGPAVDYTLDSSGDITITNNNVRIQSFSGTFDTLNNINGGFEGMLIMLHVTDTHAIILSESGNIRVAALSSIGTSTHDTILLRRGPSNWKTIEVGH